MTISQILGVGCARCMILAVCTCCTIYKLCVCIPIPANIFTIRVGNECNLWLKQIKINNRQLNTNISKIDLLQNANSHFFNVIFWCMCTSSHQFLAVCCDFQHVLYADMPITKSPMCATVIPSADFIQQTWFILCSVHSSFHVWFLLAFTQ